MSPLSVSNKKLGTGFERKFAQFLSSNGFWVHLLTQNNSGQPADVLAARKGQPFLIDCKVCQNGIFKIDRMMMRLWLGEFGGTLSIVLMMI